MTIFGNFGAHAAKCNDDSCRSTKKNGNGVIPANVQVGTKIYIIDYEQVQLPKSVYSLPVVVSGIVTFINDNEGRYWHRYVIKFDDDIKRKNELHISELYTDLKRVTNQVTGRIKRIITQRRNKIKRLQVEDEIITKHLNKVENCE